MGQFYNDRLQFFDGNGVPYANARLYTFDSIATTTPKATYSNNALTTSNGAYVQAGADGVFPQIFAASGTAFFAILKDEDGNTIQQFSFLTSLGAEDASAFERDFGTDGRVQMRGASGIPRLEFGDPAGDDVGGSGEISGWDGTQGVLLTVDMVTVALTGDLTVTGDLDVAGALTVGSSTSFPFLAASGSLASSNVIALSATYDEYMLVLDNLSSTGGVAVRITLSFDGGGTYKTAYGDYTGVSTMISTTTVTAPAATNGYIGIGEQAAATSILYGGAQLRIYSKAGKETTVTGLANLVRTGPIGEQTLLATATNAKGYGKATHIKIEATTTTWSGGRYALFGIPGL